MYKNVLLGPSQSSEGITAGFGGGGEGGYVRRIEKKTQNNAKRSRDDDIDFFIPNSFSQALVSSKIRPRGIRGMYVPVGFSRVVYEFLQVTESNGMAIYTSYAYCEICHKRATAVLTPCRCCSGSCLLNVLLIVVTAEPTTVGKRRRIHGSRAHRGF